MAGIRPFAECIAVIIVRLRKKSAKKLFGSTKTNTEINDMTTQTLKNWHEIKFKDFVKLQRGFDLPKQNRRDGVYPVIASTSITGFHDEYKVEPPCVTTGRSGALGEVLYIKSKCWPLNTALWVKDYKGNDPYFVYSKLKTLHLEQYNSGAGVPTLNRNHLDQIPINAPSLTNQKQIASVLSTYD